MPTGIYISSKVVYAPLIRELRDEGYPIICNWIDVQLDETNKPSVSHLWDVTIKEDLLKITDLVLYYPIEAHLTGAIFEAGAAWMLCWIRPGVRLHLVSALDDAIIRKHMGTFPASRKIRRWPHNNLRGALSAIAPPSP